MPIDQEMKHFVDYYYSLKLPEFGESTEVEDIRSLMRTFSSKVSGQISPNIKDVHDHSFETDIGEVRVRSYQPKENSFKKPLVYFRGSGFVIDNFDDSDLFCSKLASQCETTVLSIDYPLAPEFPFPAPVEACYQTLLKIVSNADIFGMDSTGFVLIGESSGGCIAASVAQMLRDKHGPSMGYLILIYPVTNYDFSTSSYKKMGSGYILSEDKMRWYFSKYFEKNEDAQKTYAVPMNAKDFSGLPKTLVITAQYDPLCDEGKKYADALKEAGVSCEYLCYRDLIHGFLKFNGLAAAEAAFVDMVKKIRTFLKSH
ncbi:MAG: Carboxylesterase NlhH [Chlamydiae bacterium]|nr:Carboxylesterase NlhH [Chlamydiota bacterium]